MATKPTHTAFTVEGEGEKANWHEVGAAWEHEDKRGFNVVLKSLPLNGKLVLRIPKPKSS